MWGRRVGVEGGMGGGWDRSSQEGGRKCVTAGQRAEERMSHCEAEERRWQQTLSEESPECHLL